MGDNFEFAARMGKTRGLEGQVTVHPASDLPLSLRPGLTCHVVPPVLDAPRTLVVASVETAGDSAVATFEGIDDVDVIRPLVGCYLLADADELSADAREVADAYEIDDAYDIGDVPDARGLIGWQVIDDRYGELGEVTSIISTPANDVAVTEGARGEVLIPLVSEFATANAGTRLLETRIPDGLVP